MKSIVLASAFACLACLLLASPAAHAQGVGASGDIVGTVTDPSGAVVPRTSVVAVETARGTQYAAITGATGQYRLTGLLPAEYNVTAQITGFQTVTQKGVVVNVGETSILDFSLKVATSGQTVEVSAAPPVVDTERGSQANTLTEQYITDLPIDRRDYLTFTLLLPGVSNSTRLADDQDFRVKQTPQSGLSFYGSDGVRRRSSGGRRGRPHDCEPGCGAGVPGEPQQLFRGPGRRERRLHQHRDEIGHQ
jgi:hypothetical protein